MLLLGCLLLGCLLLGCLLLGVGGGVVAPGLAGAGGGIVRRLRGHVERVGVHRGKRPRGGAPHRAVDTRATRRSRGGGALRGGATRGVRRLLLVPRGAGPSRRARSRDRRRRCVSEVSEEGAPRRFVMTRVDRLPSGATSTTGKAPGVTHRSAPVAASGTRQPAEELVAAEGSRGLASSTSSAADRAMGRADASDLARFDLRPAACSGSIGAPSRATSTVSNAPGAGPRRRRPGGSRARARWSRARRIRGCWSGPRGRGSRRRGTRRRSGGPRAPRGRRSTRAKPAWGGHSGGGRGVRRGFGRGARGEARRDGRVFRRVVGERDDGRESRASGRRAADAVAPRGGRRRVRRRDAWRIASGRRRRRDG